MAPFRITEKRRTRLWWLFVLIFLVSGGCQGRAVRSVQRLIYPRVCPACGAHAIDQCRCFPPPGQTGYYETNWSSLIPTTDHLPPAINALPPAADAAEYLEGGPTPVEELPTPGRLLPPKTQDSKGAEPAQTTSGQPSVTPGDSWQPLRDRLRQVPVTFRFHDLSEPPPIAQHR